MSRRSPRGLRGFVTAQRAVEWAAIVAGFVIVRLLGRPTNWLGWLLLVLAGVLVAAPVVLGALREYLREQQTTSAVELATAYRMKLAVTLGDALTPLADLLGRINLADTARRPALQAQLQQGVVDAASALCGGQRTRATFFVLRGDDLVPEAWAGRAHAPPSQSLAGKDRSSKLLQELVRTHGRVLVSEADERHRPIRVESPGDYQAAVLAVVYAGSLELGVLCADSPDRGVLEAADLDILATLAQLLGAGLATAAYRDPNGHSSAQRG
jgi:hypothetical protein